MDIDREKDKNGAPLPAGRPSRSLDERDARSRPLANRWAAAGGGLPRRPLVDDDLNKESAALGELAHAFTTLARALTGEQDVTPISPERIIQLAVDCVPRVHHAILLVVADGMARTLTATTDLADRIDNIGSATGQSPGLDVLRTMEFVVSNDLATDSRWPRFGARLVAELGLRSIICYRLHLPVHHRPALCFYSTWPYAFDTLAIPLGALVAAYCSMATCSPATCAPATCTPPAHRQR